MKRRTALAALMMAATGCAAMAAGEMSAAATQGQAIVRNTCGSCHATDVADASSDPQAPAFREVAHLYPPEDLSESLAEGILTGHAEMPEFVFQPDAIGDIIAYLEWLGAQ